MGADSPLFSVCMPAYNSLPLIRSSFASLASQSFCDWELILVDDCSDDVLDAWVFEQTIIESNHIRYFKLSENRGPFYARRVAFHAARGKYILCLDSDDEFVGRDALMSLSKQIESYCAKPDVIMFNAKTEQDDLKSWVDYTAEGLSTGFVPKNKVVDIFLSTHKLNNLWLKAIKTSLLATTGLENAEGFKMCEDRLEVAGVIKSAESFVLFDEPIYYYRQNELSTTHQLFEICYCEQQSYVEATITRMFEDCRETCRQRRQFLLLWADDMARIAKGRDITDIASCYALMKEDGYFQESYAYVGTSGLRPDRAALLALLIGGHLRSAALLARLLNRFRLLLKQIGKILHRI